MKELKRFLKRIITNSPDTKLEYSVFSNDREKIQKVMDALINATEFEAPDGYYYDVSTKILYIFEHFEFDCSPRKRKGSKLRESIATVNREITQSINNSNDDEMSFANIIEQGYSTFADNTITYRMGEMVMNIEKTISLIFLNHLQNIISK